MGENIKKIQPEELEMSKISKKVYILVKTKKRHKN